MSVNTIHKGLLLALLMALACVGQAIAGSQQLTPTNSTALITKIRSNLNESIASFWTDAELLAWMNDGIKDIATKTRAMQTTENATTVDGAVEYTVSTDYIGIVGVTFWSNSTNPKALSRRNPFSETSGIGKSAAVKEPVYFADWNGKILAWPVCSGANAGKQMVIYLTARPSAIASGDNIPIPSYLDNALEWYVTAQALHKDIMDSRAGYFKAMYQAEIDRYRADFIDFGQEPKDQ